MDKRVNDPNDTQGRAVQPADTPRWLKVLVWVTILAVAASILIRAYSDPAKLHVPLWLIWMLTGALAITPIIIFTPQQNRKRTLLLSAIFFSVITLALCWVAFFPGERIFVGKSRMYFGPVSTSSRGNDMEGRAFFAIFATFSAAGTAWIWSRWRKECIAPTGVAETPELRGWHRKHSRRKNAENRKTP